jgi:hypothetical protein
VIFLPRACDLDRDRLRIFLLQRVALRLRWHTIVDAFAVTEVPGRNRILSGPESSLRVARIPLRLGELDEDAVPRLMPGVACLGQDITEANRILVPDGYEPDIAQAPEIG